MKEKDIKRIIRKQLKSNHPNWQRIPKKRKKEIVKEITNAVIADYQEFDEELVQSGLNLPVLSEASFSSFSGRLVVKKQWKINALGTFCHIL
ncbi:hypothetical protein VU04_10610 [Desulfobulbus sp. TB]|nr:hypothetical protein [Desulfobulbus sp. TB]